MELSRPYTVVGIFSSTLIITIFPNKYKLHLSQVPSTMIQHHIRHIIAKKYIVQELCESRGGRPGLSVLTSLLVSADIKNY